MSRAQAQAVAFLLNGEAFQSGGNIWLVRIRKPSGRLIVFAGDCVAEYVSDAAYEAGEEYTLIEW